MYKTFCTVIAALALAAFTPQEPDPAMSPETQAAVAAWRAEFQNAIDSAAAHPPQTFAEELDRRLGVEQAGRGAIGLIRNAGLPPDQMALATTEIWKELGSHDAANTEWLKSNLPPDGWFRISRDGARTATNAWLIVQHSPDTEWQKTILARMTPLIAEKEVNGRDYALLYDRVELFAGRPQRYGSQGTCEGGRLVIHKLEDAQRVDEWRASVGLGPLEEYKKVLGVGRAC